MNDIYQKALDLHEQKKGKIEISSKVRVTNKEELSLAYSPGVAAPCLKIKDNENDIYKYTSKSNTVAVISDGSAVLGLGNIGARASLPVMEGKSILFKEFANIDSFPIILDTQDTEMIIQTVKMIAPSFGGINLEDIKAPKCVEIEKRLKEELDIPVFHDDQHGTAIITSAALINSCKLTKKNISDIVVCLSGVGAAGSSIAKMLKMLGVKALYASDVNGVISMDNYDSYDFLTKELIDTNIIDTNHDYIDFADTFKNADMFVGVSAPNIVTKEMIASMNDNPFVFAMANPTPEIMPDIAKDAGALIVGTGRSDFANQVNNVLAFPGIFRGVLDANAKEITEKMKLAAAYAIAETIDNKDLTADYIIPSPFDKKVVKNVSEAVQKIAKLQKLTKL